ncbi:hypothetical protein FM038_016985 [Shewanella eurypsychrophilus]|uniref:Lipoprotein n=1 Tax=Shewanella eurypsychrophilus TaxID=2593656 RepID=A0ABX6V8F3_9GAMM|nr:MULTISPECIES: hypothetical protein [Shewanella]QFU23700.1 hypothetical protein FS418_18785 [Shewanella sp. YLB-09]QPG58922.1 hypothetical protein FM038_016985 [Shewanella eurypsychrophilus]
MNLSKTSLLTGIVAAIFISGCSSTSSVKDNTDPDFGNPGLELPIEIPATPHNPIETGPDNDLPETDPGYGLPDFGDTPDWGAGKDRPDVGDKPADNSPEFDDDGGWTNDSKPKPDVNPFMLVIDEEHGQAKIYRKEDGKTIAIIEPNGDGTYTVRDGAMSWDNTYVIYQDDLGQLRIDWERSEIDAGWGNTGKTPKTSLSQAQRDTIKSRVNAAKLKSQLPKR